MQAPHNTTHNASQTKSAQNQGLVKPTPTNGKSSTTSAKMPSEKSHQQATPTGKAGNKNSVLAKGVPQMIQKSADKAEKKRGINLIIVN